MTEIEVPAHSAGPPLHTHDFDEAFHMLEGEVIFQWTGSSRSKARGELSLAPRNVAHAWPITATRPRATCSSARLRASSAIGRA